MDVGLEVEGSVSSLQAHGRRLHIDRLEVHSAHGQRAGVLILLFSSTGRANRNLFEPAPESEEESEEEESEDWEEESVLVSDAELVEPQAVMDTVMEPASSRPSRAASFLFFIIVIPFLYLW